MQQERNMPPLAATSAVSERQRPKQANACEYALNIRKDRERLRNVLGGERETTMTVIELIRILRKLENKGKDVKCIGLESEVTVVEELENEIILR